MAQQPEYQQTVSEAKTLPPMRIGEVVLKTARFDAMNGWWQTVLGISPFLESERFAFRRLSGDHPYTQLLRVSSNEQKRLVNLAAKHRIPTVYPWREPVDAGGFPSYGPNLNDLYRRAAYFVDKILKGAKPGDLPVEQPN